MSYSAQVLQHRVHQSRAPGGPQSGAFGTKRLTWQELLSTDSAELKRIVGGLGNTVITLKYYFINSQHS